MEMEMIMTVPTFKKINPSSHQVLVVDEDNTATNIATATTTATDSSSSTNDKKDKEKKKNDNNELEYPLPKGQLSKAAKINALAMSLQREE